MKSNIEKLFKNKFENFSYQPPSNLWDKINKKLVKVKIIKTTAIVISAIIIAGTGLLLFSNKNLIISTPEKSDNIISNNRIVQIKNEIVQKENNVNNNTQNQNNTKNHNKIISAKSNILYVDLSSDSSVMVYKPFENKEKAKTMGFVLSPNYGCTPLTVRLENSNPDYDELKWVVNNTVYNNTDIVDVAIEEPGDYEILLYREENGEAFLYYDSVKVEATPTADFNVPEYIFVNKKVTFENLSFDADSYIWFVNNNKISNEFEPSYVFDKEGTYKITLIATNNKKCSDTIFKNITVEAPAEKIVFPTAFSPNIYGAKGGFYNENDKNNEVFHPVAFQDLLEFNMVIFNKYGIQIFETNDIMVGWDGYYKNSLVEVGVYVYSAKGKFADGEEFVKQGSVTVLYEK